MTSSPGICAPRLVEVTVGGEPEALGAAHGEGLRDVIAEVYAWRMGEIVAATGEAEEDVLARAARYRAAADRGAPDLVREVHGIGRGSGLGFERAFFLQVATEVSLEPVGGAASGSAGCSAIGIAGNPGGPVVAQNWDQPAASAGKQVVLRLRPTGKPEILQFAHAGVLGYIGLNDRGLGHVGNQLYTSLPGRVDGLTQYFVNRRLLEFDDLPSALAWLTATPVASTCNYLIGDASGALADIELGGGRATIQAQGPALSHTNHYLLAPFFATDTHRDVLPDSPARLASLRAGAIGVESLRDHTGHPTSVCRHEDPPGLTTRASIALRLAAREIAAAAGPPCVTPYATYGFGVA